MRVLLLLRGSAGFRCLLQRNLIRIVIMHRGLKR